MKKILSILCILVVTLGLSACGNVGLVGSITGENGVSSGTNKANKDYSKKVSITSHQLPDNNILGLIKNNSNKVLDVEAAIAYYDEEDNLIYSEPENAFGMAPGAQMAVEFYVDEEIEDYYRYEIELEAEESYWDAIPIDELVIKNNNTGSKVTTQVTNNSGKDNLYITANVIYFKNGKVIGFDYESKSNVNNGKTANFTFDYPRDKNYNKISFDEYEVYANAYIEV